MSLGIILAVSCRGEEAMKVESQRVVRKAMGAGRWFPASPAKLKAMIAEDIEQAQVGPVTGRIVAAISPHAGYECSGRVAGYVFRAIRDQAKKGDAPKTVVILGVSHQVGFRGVALMDGDAMTTPLGESALDREAASLLVRQSPMIRMDYKPHVGEHSAENQVPFVQAILPAARLVIGLIGDHDPQTLAGLTKALGELAQKQAILVIASSDMLHDPDYDLVTKTDQQTLQEVTAMNLAVLMSGWSPRHQLFCGMSAVAATLDFAKAGGCREGTVLFYRNSGDYFPEGRGQWVVGYGAVVFTVPGK
ncbi:MAG: AmmeMemoRadiSam system protein B [Verrucomicrobia bacterium]|nr:AmmeMemoRadiSam system protein B [Verrucomicrobiota bacterium]MBU4290816.1 AmmeMemoRadiSam system protein B [Verrucomicrobiota bacterium]MBU4496665.1 AmmeMemoRadiSam system protein B [Verrucomicrobiota bacterium]MCG2678979.1 AmmeMemoRadiSam system protein B [Kiritimatiellia bacterium]